MVIRVSTVLHSVYNGALKDSDYFHCAHKTHTAALAGGGVCFDFHLELSERVLSLRAAA